MNKVTKIVPNQVIDPEFKSKQSASILSQIMLIAIATLNLHL